MPSLSTLLASLVQEGAAGAVDGERRARQERAALEERLSDPPSSFVQEQEVDAVLREQFPPLEEPPVDLLRKNLHPVVLDRYLETWERGTSAVRPYEVVMHPSVVKEWRAPQFEGLEELLDRDLTELPLERRGNVAFLTPEAVEEIRTAVATDIGSRRRSALKRLADDEIPQPVVEDVELDVKLSLDESLDAVAVDAIDGVADSEAVGSLSTRMHFK